MEIRSVRNGLGILACTMLFNGPVSASSQPDSSERAKQPIVTAMMGMPLQFEANEG
jgi:hypothetical protein